ncbi:hypothetical protein MMC24_001351 [Lignoscripta atroalba]|nr:hypothetical protein [Lignoscripta atroalba]
MSSEKVTIEIGSKPYNIDTTKIPYFQSYTSFQAHSGQDASQLTHSEIPLFDAAHYGIEHGFRQYFRKLDPDLTQYHTLCDTLDFLCVDVLKGCSTDAIIQGLKSGKAQYELEYKYYREMKSSKSPARDSAFKLLYLILTAEFNESDISKEKQKMYNVIFFIMSHSVIFKYRTHKILRAAYEERFQPSEKQVAKMNQ